MWLRQSVPKHIKSNNYSFDVSVSRSCGIDTARMSKYIGGDNLQAVATCKPLPYIYILFTFYI